jgi:orotidine-5'-phosphate decarboxylase
MELGNRLVVALDVPDRGAADALVSAVGDAADWVKIGLELFIAAGPDLVRDYAAAGRRVMLDLKLHDIPATVERATRQAADLGARLLTIHAAGGRAMMEAAARAARASTGPDRLHTLAVTVLTSMTDDDAAQTGAGEPVERLVTRRAQLAMEAGCDGIVCSPLEAATLRRGAPEDFLIVTPGVRPAGADRGDQKRVATPAEARRAGADLVVVGRPIRDAPSPRQAAAAIAAELAAAGSP